MAIKRINYPRWNNIFSIFFLSFILSACGGGDGDDESPNPPDEKYSVVTKQIKLDASPSCPYGGITIETGIDGNGNGLLDANEVSDSQPVCHGSSSLIKLFDEPAGSNCSSGGKKIISGIDSNGNGLLDDGEYEVQGFICNGSDGSITTPSNPELSPLGRISGYIDPSIFPIKSYSRSRSAISTLSSGNVASTAVITSECISGVVDSPQKAIEKSSQIIIEPIEIPVDSTGHFSVDVPACDDYSLIIVNEDQGYKQENISVGSNEEVQLIDINEEDLKSTGSVTFKLLSEYNNTPISNAQVVFYPLLDNAISDENGVISINGLPAGNYSAVINHSHFVKKALDFQIISDNITDKENVILSIEKGSATGKVSAEGLDNIANIPLYLRAIDGTIYTALTNESGIYRFNNLPTGDGYSVIASPNDFVARKVDNIKIESNITTLIDPILLVRELKGNGNIVGFALYSDRVSSNNHAGILVSIEGTDKEAITGRDGSFVFTGIVAGEYILNINDSNYISLSKNIKVIKNSTITLDPITIISQTGSLSGSVVDENKKPISNIDVLLMPNGFVTKTNSEGSFRFSNIPISNYTLEINESGYHKISSSVSIPVESINEEVILSTPFELLPIIFSGKVTSQDKGLANASVILSGGKLSSDISVKTSTLGDFEFYRLVAGNYKLEINAKGYTSLTLPISLSGDSDYVLPYDINLERTYGVLSGIVTLADETDYSGIAVSIPDYTQNIVTDSTGQWQVTLPSGLYNGQVTYTKSGYITHSTEEQFTIEALQTVNLTAVKLNKVTGSIVGVVVNENGEKLSGVVVADKQSAAQFITDEQGRYQFTNVAVGEHQLSIEKSGFVSQQQTVLVEEGKEATVSDTVLMARKLMGTVTDGEKGIADVLITLVSVGGAQTAITTQSNNNGEFIFSGVNVGSHQIKISKSGYKGVQSLILIPDVAEYKIPQIELVAVQGTVKGITTLSKRTDHAGINVKLNDMPYSTSTDAVGAWSLSLPLGNYSQGVIFSKELYETKTYDKTLVINEFGEFNIGAVNLAQTHSVIRFNVSADNSCPSELSVTFKGDNFNAKYPITNGIFEATLPLGVYHYTIACSTTGWETIIDTVTLNEGLEFVELSDHILRRSYVVINKGQIVTNDSMLNLAIGHSDAVLMNITESNNSTGWITFKEQYYLDVGNTDGEKTVTVQFRDNNGTELSSQTDSILLDTQIDVNSFIADGATTKGDQLTLKLDLNGELNATVTANLAGVFEDLKLLDNGAGGDLSANDGVYERTFIITTPKEINAYVNAEIVDLATNTKTLNSAQKVVLSTAPTIDNIDVESNVKNGTMSIRFTTDEPTTTYIHYGMKADQLTTKLSVSDVFSQNHNVTLSDLNSNQTIWYRITATDVANHTGYKQGSNKLAPSMINNIVAYAGNEEIGLIWDKSEVKLVIGYRLYRSEDDGISYVVVNPEMLIKETYFNDLAVKNDTNYTYYVTALDANDNESMPSLTASATPKLILAGPTNVNGGIIQQNEVWLKSRSPYQLTANMKISEQTKLVLLPGTEIVFVGDDTVADGDVNQRYMQVAGQLFGYGTEKQPITIHTTDNVVYPYFEFSNSDSDGIKEYTNYIQFTHANIDSVTIKNGGYTEFNNVNMRMANSYTTSSYDHNDYVYVELAIDSIFIDASGYKSESQDCQYDENSYWVCENIESWTDTRNYRFIVSEANNVVFKHEHQSYLDTLSKTYQRQLSVTVNRGDKLNLGAGTYQSNYLNSSILNNVSINSNNIVNSTIIKSEIYSSDLTMNYNILDEHTTLSSSARGTKPQLNLSHNYWGTIDFKAILARSGYSSGDNNNLYPIITTAELYLADHDNDGIADYIDPDNDNDGYSDVQEDKASVFESEFGGTQIYDPLDPNSHPGNDGIEPDSDNDGIVDDKDDDIDGDGLSNENEIEHGTNPNIADTDGDGVNDNIEVSNGYDPLNKDSVPLIGHLNRVVIDNRYANALGQVVIGDGTTFSDCIVMAGTEIVIDGAANPRFNRCEFNGEFGQPISITNGNYDKDNLSPRLSLYDNTLNYVIMKNMGQRYVDIDYSRINNSEFYLSDRNDYVSWYYISFSNSYIETPDSFSMYYSEINHSKLEFRNYSYMSSSIVNNSYIQSNGYSFGGNNNTIISNSVVNATIDDIGKVESSIYQKNYIRGGNSFFNNVDFEKIPSVGNENTFFFDGVAILNQDKVIDYGYGNPEDREGDGIAETQVCALNSCITIDGVTNPRTVRNFANGVHDLWDMRNVGTGIIEPGIATAVINTPLYIQMPMKEGNDLYQGLFNFNADGTFTYKSYIAQVGAPEWMEDFDGDGNGYWYVSNGRIYFTWLNGRGIWASISVAIDDNGKVIFDGQTVSDVSSPPKTEQEMVDDGFAYYRLSGVAKFKDYTGRWIRIPENTNAYVNSFNGLINMPIDSTTGVFGFDGWLAKDQFNANNSTTVYVYHNENLNGIYDYFERQLGHASYQSRQFGNNETPLVLTYLSEGIEPNDLQGRTYYRIQENNDGSLEMMSAYLSSQSTALYKFYSAHYGDKQWTYLGNDCDQLGCIPTKEDITGTWSISSNQVSQTITTDVTSYSDVDGILNLIHYIEESYQISKVDINTNIVAKRSIGPSYQYGEAYLNEVIYMEKPLVPVNQSQTNDKLERIGSITFDSYSINYSYYQSLLYRYRNNNSDDYLNYYYNVMKLSSNLKRSYNSKTLNRYNDIYNRWYWNVNGISDHTIHYSDINYHQDGSLELLNTDTTVAKKIWAVTAPDNNTRIVQYDGDYPVLWTHDVPDMSGNGIQLPPTSLSRLAVNLIEGNTWINHVSGNTFIEMEFLPSNILVLTKISWINDEWNTVGNEVRTSWSDKNGYLTFDFDGKEQRLHIISLGTDTAGLWELNSGEAQVWLAERPKFISSSIMQK